MYHVLLLLLDFNKSTLYYEYSKNRQIMVNASPDHCGNFYNIYLHPSNLHRR